jgi:dipeptidyl aminopeptidase/acylaminoacyl peptidase
VLGDPAVGDYEVSVVLDQPHATTSRALSRFFRERKPDDLLLAHFSCHGIKDEHGVLHFASVDTDVEDLDATAISSDWLRRVMDKCRSRRIVVMLDCCHSGAIGRGLLARGSAQVHTRERLEGRGRVLLTASDSLEYAFEGDRVDGEGRPSIFTSAVVHGLESGAADRDGDGWVSVAELFRHVEERVQDETSYMHPRMWALDMQGELRIALSPRGPRSSDLPADIRQRLESPLSAVRGAAVESLATALASTNLHTVAAARLALQSLVEDDSRLISDAAQTALSGHPDVASHAPGAATVASRPTPGDWTSEHIHERAQLVHDEMVAAVAFSADGRLLATASSDARVWELATDRERTRLPHDESVIAVAFSPDGRTLCTACEDKKVRLWDLTAERPQKEFAHTHEPQAVAFSPDGELLAVAAADEVIVWHIDSGRKQARLRGHNWVEDVAFSPDGQSLATGGHNDTARIRELGSGHRSLLRVRHDSTVTGVAFSPNGCLLATASMDESARIWDVTSGSELARLPHDSFVHSVAFSPDGQLLAAACWEPDVARLWNITSHREQARVPHRAGLYDVAFSPDGGLLATAGGDHTARIWIAGSRS